MSPNEKVLKLSAENEVLLKNLNRLTKIEADNKQKLEKNTGKMKVFCLFLEKFQISKIMILIVKQF